MEGRPPYSEIEHTADIGFELEAASRTAAFEAAALAMFDLMVDLDGVGDDWSGTLQASGEAGDLENLMVRWLSELLYLHDDEGIVVRSVSIVRLDDGGVEAELRGEPLDPSRHDVRSEVKAATYHGLSVVEEGGRWRVRVIFDT